MLEAVVKGKYNIKKRKLLEDDVTSCIFGPVVFFENRAAARDLYDFFLELLPGNIALAQPFTVQGMEFKIWPKLKKVGATLREPDLIIIFKNDKTILLVLLIEVKWGKRQSNPKDCQKSGRFQLSEQWDRLGPNLRKKAQHIYLVLNKNNGDEEIRLMDDVHKDVFPYKGLDLKDWQRRRSVIGWPELATALRYHNFSTLGRWAESVVRFLDKTGKVSVWKGYTFAAKNYSNKLLFKKIIYFKRKRKLFIDPCLYKAGGTIQGSYIYWKKRRGFLEQIGNLKITEFDKSNGLFYAPIK